MNSLIKPIELLSQWIQDEWSNNDNDDFVACLSTMGLDDYPNARLVDFQEIIDNEIMITSPLNELWSKEIEQNNKVALTFCWSNTKRRVRIFGTASLLKNHLADQYFDNLPTSAKAIALVCENGAELEDEREMKRKVADVLAKQISNPSGISRPDSWGGYAIDIKRIELRECKETNFHRYHLYERDKETWTVKQLQP